MMINRCRAVPTGLAVVGMLSLALVSCRGIERLGTGGVVMQQHQWDYGAAALKMIFDHFGIDSSYDDFLRGIDTGARTGASMLTLKQLSENRGLRCAGWRLAAEDLRSIPLPAIHLLRRQHYVVLRSVSPNGDALLLDPARGRLRVPFRRLCSLWGGESLLFNSHGTNPCGYRRWFGVPLTKERSYKNEGNLCVTNDSVDHVGGGGAGRTSGSERAADIQ